MTGTNRIFCTLLCFFFAAVASPDDGRSDLPKVTFVTALYDIGRGSWANFARPFPVYLARFQHLLALDINLIVYGEQSLEPFVKQYRGSNKSTISKTKFVSKPFSDLPAYRHKLRMECIFELDSFREDNEKLGQPEAFSSHYLILVNSKISLVADAIRQNPFNTTYFFWIDAGYAAVNDDVEHDVISVHIPAGVQWIPQPLLPFWDRVTFLQLHHPALYTEVPDLHKRRLQPAFAGGFFGGGAEVLLYYEKLFHKRLLYELAEGEIGEDQRIALHVYLEHPRLFHLVPGDWFDAYSLFH